MIDLAQFDTGDLAERVKSHLDHVGERCSTRRRLYSDKDGYPILCVRHHRVLRTGRLPPVARTDRHGRLIWHARDNPTRVNPAHPNAGTVGDNAGHAKTDAGRQAAAWSARSAHTARAGGRRQPRGSEREMAVARSGLVRQLNQRPSVGSTASC
jgi:hypothetical protein